MGTLVSKRIVDRRACPSPFVLETIVWGEFDPSAYSLYLSASVTAIFAGMRKGVIVCHQGARSLHLVKAAVSVYTVKKS